MSELSKVDAPAPLQVLNMLAGSFVARAVGIAAELGLADRLAEARATPGELASALALDPHALYRLLRALASVGVFQEHEDGRFANTALSDTLRSDAPGSLKSMAAFLCGRVHWGAWTELDHALRTGRSAFANAHGASPFEYMKRDVAFAGVFDDAMTRLTRQDIAAIHASVDLSRFGTLVDVGGGEGALLTSFLARHPRQRGILFDQPEVIAKARGLVAEQGLGERCELCAGDFFASVPGGGDAYLLKYVCHDWSDEQVVAILRNIHRAAPPGARLFSMDTLLQPGNAPDFAKLLDLQVLAFYGGGRERTLAQFTALFDAAGFRLVRAVPTMSLVGVLEAERV